MAELLDRRVIDVLPRLDSEKGVIKLAGYDNWSNCRLDHSAEAVTCQFFMENPLEHDRQPAIDGSRRLRKYRKASLALVVLFVKLLSIQFAHNRPSLVFATLPPLFVEGNP